MNWRRAILALLCLSTLLLAAPPRPVRAEVTVAAASSVPPQNQTILNDLFGDPTAAGTSNVVGQIADHYVAGNAQELGRVMEKVDKFTRKFRNRSNLQHYNDLTRTSAAADRIKLKGDLVKFGGKAYSMYCLKNDIWTYLDKSNHRHSSLAFLDQTARGFNIVASGLDLFNVKLVKPLAIGGGLVKDTIGGHAFANWANQQDNIVLEYADSAIDTVNEWVFVAMLEYIEMYDSLVDGNTHGRPPFGTLVYKPNIYLYPEDEIPVTVIFGLPALLVDTLPRYTSQWQVTAAPNGQLTDSDGKNYGFLFYESETDPALFNYREGWILSANDRERQLRQIMGQFGFNAAETRDFIDFWISKLVPGTDYCLYPQPTEIVDCAMPLIVSPEPDSIFRLWFAFVPCTGQTPHQPEITPIIRDGFSLVEWGGFIVD